MAFKPQVQDQIQRQLAGVGQAQMDAAEFAAESARLSKEKQHRAAELEEQHRRRSRLVRGRVHGYSCLYSSMSASLTIMK